MIQIRNNTFETNSSSSHALVYAPNSYREAMLPSYNWDKEVLYAIEDSVLYIGRYSSLYFGRAPFKILYSFLDKVRYAYANFVYSEKSLQELLAVVQKFYPEITRISPHCSKYNELEYQDWVKRGKPDDEYGYVEHISAGTDEPYLESWMDQYNFDLEKFLTNPHYVVIVDGDEYCIWKDMQKLGIAYSNQEPKG